MEAVPIHRSPSLSSVTSSRSSSNTLGNDRINREPQRPPTAIINRIKRLSFLTWLPSKELNHPGNDLPIVDTSKTTLRRSRSKKKTVRQITKEWLLAALTIIMGGFIAGVFVITGIESAASSIRHKTTASNRWNSSTSASNSQAPPIPTDSSQLTDSTSFNDSQPLDPTQIPYAVEVLPDLTKLITCTNPTVVDAVAFPSILNQPLNMVDPGFIPCYSCVLLTSPTSDARVVAVVVDSFAPQSNHSLLVNAKTFNKLNTSHKHGSRMVVQWQPSNC